MIKLALALLVGLPLCACERTSHSSPPPATATAAAGAVGDDASVPRLAVGTKAKCAVTGEEFTVSDSTVQVTYGKKRYAFCCADCRPTFQKNPAKYAAK